MKKLAYALIPALLIGAFVYAQPSSQNCQTGSLCKALWFWSTRTTGTALKLSGDSGILFGDGTMQNTAGGGGGSSQWTTINASHIDYGGLASADAGQFNKQVAIGGPVGSAYMLDITGDAGITDIALRNGSTSGFSSIQFFDSTGASQGSLGLGNSGDATNFTAFFWFFSEDLFFNSSDATPTMVMKGSSHRVVIGNGSSTDNGTDLLQVAGTISAAGTIKSSVASGSNAMTTVQGARISTNAGTTYCAGDSNNDMNFTYGSTDGVGQVASTENAVNFTAASNRVIRLGQCGGANAYTVDCLGNFSAITAGPAHNYAPVVHASNHANPQAVEHGKCSLTSGSCSVTFGTAFSAAPDCTCSPDGSTVTSGCAVGTPGTSSFTITTVATAANAYWHCDGDR